MKNEEKNIYKEVKRRSRITFLIGIAISLCIIILFGYAGYLYASENQLNSLTGVFLGISLPFAVLFFKEKFEFGLIGSGVVILGVAILAEFLPFYIAIALAVSMLILFFSKLEEFCKDRYRADLQHEMSKAEYEGMSAAEKNLHTSQKPKKMSPRTTSYDKDSGMISEKDIEEVFHCERCEKNIAEQEYIDNDGLCEDCYEDVIENKGEW